MIRTLTRRQTNSRPPSAPASCLESEEPAGEEGQAEERRAIDGATAASVSAVAGIAAARDRRAIAGAIVAGARRGARGAKRTRTREEGEATELRATDGPRRCPSPRRRPSPRSSGSPARGRRAVAAATSTAPSSPGSGEGPAARSARGRAPARASAGRGRGRGVGRGVVVARRRRGRHGVGGGVGGAVRCCSARTTSLVAGGRPMVGHTSPYKGRARCGVGHWRDSPSGDQVCGPQLQW